VAEVVQTSGPTTARRELLGCPFDPVTMEGAIARSLSWCHAPRRTHTLITMNAALVCSMRSDPELREACRRGDLVVPDGVPIVWTARLAGVPLPERVAGVDLMARLLEAGGRNGLSAYFLGAKREVVEALVKRCRDRHAGLTVAGYRDGYFGPSDHEAVVADVRGSGAHMLFVGMPSPFKETWCEKHREALAVPLVMGVGGSFDVLAGFTRRAPRALQKAGMEWSWRLAMEPRRMWRRYLTTNSRFLWLAAGEVARRRLSDGAKAAR
jgi:N-acetylglucosaminyldiphosphoundecaprenol N-acetyl-beta-D-mannosaminyltransferase